MNYFDRISEKRSTSFRHRLLRGSALLLFVAALAAGISTQASPFRNLRVPFTQPDDTKIEVIGSGDEFLTPSSKLRMASQWCSIKP